MYLQAGHKSFILGSPGAESMYARACMIDRPHESCGVLDMHNWSRKT